MGFLALEPDNEGLDLGWQLVGIAHRTARAVRKGFKPAILVPLEDLVAGLAGDTKLPADVGHRFALEQLRHESQALVHHRTLLPRHRHLPSRDGKCYPCVRYACNLCVGPLMRVSTGLAVAFHSAKPAVFRNSVDYLVGVTLSPARERR